MVCHLSCQIPLCSSDRSRDLHGSLMDAASVVDHIVSRAGSTPIAIVKWKKYGWRKYFIITVQTSPRLPLDKPHSYKPIMTAPPCTSHIMNSDLLRLEASHQFSKNGCSRSGRDRNNRFVGRLHGGHCPPGKSNNEGDDGWKVFCPYRQSSFSYHRMNIV